MDKKIIFGFFCLFLLIPMANIASACFVNYPSVIYNEVHPDSIDDLVEPIEINYTVYVKLQVGYAVTVPSRLLYGGLLARLWVFKGLIIPPMKIHLEEKNIPQDVDIAVTTPDVYISDYSNSFVYTTTNLVITPGPGAEPGQYYVDLEAESMPVGRILSSTFTKRIFFSVAGS